MEKLRRRAKEVAWDALAEEGAELRFQDSTVASALLKLLNTSGVIVKDLVLSLFFRKPRVRLVSLSMVEGWLGIRGGHLPCCSGCLPLLFSHWKLLLLHDTKR